MPIVKNLVELMGGRIDVKSKQGEGSIFTVELELRIQDQKVDEGFWEKHGITRVLVVDDDETICINVIRAMEGTGVSVQYALGGDRAIRQIRESHQEGTAFDLVLLDWKMLIWTASKRPGIFGRCCRNIYRLSFLPHTNGRRLRKRPLRPALMVSLQNRFS